MESSINYINAKARIIRVLTRIGTFVRVSGDYNNDQSNVRAKIIIMLLELNEIHRHVEADIQIMESSVSEHTAPIEIIDNQCSTSIINLFDTMYYEIAAFCSFTSLTLNYDLSGNFRLEKKPCSS